MENLTPAVVLVGLVVHVALSCRQDSVPVDLNRRDQVTHWGRSKFWLGKGNDRTAMRQVVKWAGRRSPNKVIVPPGIPVDIEIRTTNGNIFDLKRTCVRTTGMCDVSLDYIRVDGTRLLLGQWDRQGMTLSNRLCCKQDNGCFRTGLVRGVYNLMWHFTPCSNASRPALKDVFARTCWNSEALTTTTTTPTEAPTTATADLADCSGSSSLTVEYGASFQSTPIRIVGDVNAGVSMCEASLYAHNSVRMLHQDTPLLVYDDSLAATAERYAMTLANTTSSLVHSTSESRNEAGENLYWGGSSLNIYHSQADATFYWYNEAVECNYDYTTGAPADGGSCTIGHFTQVAWDETVSIGCGAAQGIGDIFGTTWYYTYHVCHYAPQGNFIGQNPAHVQPLKSGVVPPTNTTQIEAEGCVQKSTRCAQFVSNNYCTSSTRFMAVLCPCDCP